MSEISETGGTILGGENIPRRLCSPAIQLVCHLQEQRFPYNLCNNMFALVSSQPWEVHTDAQDLTSWQCLCWRYTTIRDKHKSQT